MKEILRPGKLTFGTSNRTGDEGLNESGDGAVKALRDVVVDSVAERRSNGKRAR